jgi:hypothetical protein
LPASIRAHPIAWNSNCDPPAAAHRPLRAPETGSPFTMTLAKPEVSTRHGIRNAACSTPRVSCFCPWSTPGSWSHHNRPLRIRLDAVMGLSRSVSGGAAVPQRDDVNGVRTGRPQASSRDSHGALCRDRRGAGTEQPVRGGWDRTDRREAKVASEPEALIRFLGQLGLVVTRIGIEAGPLSQWLHAA